VRERRGGGQDRLTLVLGSGDRHSYECSSEIEVDK
jgi:hypothetical protein